VNTKIFLEKRKETASEARRRDWEVKTKENAQDVGERQEITDTYQIPALGEHALEVPKKAETEGLGLFWMREEKISLRPAANRLKCIGVRILFKRLADHPT